LNLIVYLNKEWKGVWGGALAIHSDPRQPFENRVWSYDPLFNRYVMFETNERSWHGFPQIDLPPDRGHLPHKSISISSIRKIVRPKRFRRSTARSTCSVSCRNRFGGPHADRRDVDRLRRLLIRRDGWIEMYQHMELSRNRVIAEKSMIAAMGRHARAALSGYLVDEASQGAY
jgi:hypothetical protein